MTNRERTALLRREKAEHAARLFLDVRKAHTYKDISERLDISIHSLKDLIKTPEFDQAYNDMFAEAGHDPRYQAARQAVADLLPKAVTVLEDLIENPQTADGVKFRAVSRILELNGLDEPTAQSDRHEIAQFLTDRNIKVENINITLPPEYLEEIVEGELVEPAVLVSNPHEDTKTPEPSS